jgi:hypothetical protein
MSFTKNKTHQVVLATSFSGLFLGLLALSQLMAFFHLTVAAQAPKPPSQFVSQESQWLAESSEAEESASAAAQIVEELSVDDGSFEMGAGVTSGSTLYCANRLRPPRYPATLSQVKIFFSITSGVRARDSLVVLIGANPDGDATIDGTAFQRVRGRVTALNQFNIYAVSNLTITSGDFVVGFQMSPRANATPGAIDTTPPSQQRSYTSGNGVSFTLSNGNLGIRAVVTVPPPLDALVASSGDAPSLGDLTRVQDPLASGSISGNIVTQGLTRELAVAPNGAYALAFPAGDGGMSVSLITGLGSSNSMESRLLDVGDVPRAVAISSDSATALVIGQTSRRRIMGLPSSPQISNQIPLFERYEAGDVALSPSGTSALISGGPGIEVINLNPTGFEIKVRSQSDFRLHGAAIALDGDTGFVVNSSGNSMLALTGILPGRPLRIVATITDGVGEAPRTIRLTPDGSRAVVTNFGSNTVSIFMVSGTDLMLVRMLPVGEGPAGLAIAPDGKSALVANVLSRTLSVIGGLDTMEPFVSRTIGPDDRLATADVEQSVAWIPGAVSR